ncbi:hypothetical protein [uncultured Propionivibrio sp.]|uniref:hypothetical protein n=1 Tax=uncultured Propionivibrio sp. TaxID=426737 RepID=UPI0029BFF772|nr:hypothetical protein [uncultured Propionivibrio sp.]
MLLRGQSASFNPACRSIKAAANSRNDVTFPPIRGFSPVSKVMAVTRASESEKITNAFLGILLANAE